MSLRGERWFQSQKVVSSASTGGMEMLGMGREPKWKDFTALGASSCHTCISLLR